MGRKNRNAHQRNIKGRLDRRQKGQPRPPAKTTGTAYRPSVDDIVMPDGQCFFYGRKPKAKFATEAKAARALEQARLRRQYTNAPIERTEKRYYRCPEGGCGGWHLSSRGSFDEAAWKARRESQDRQADQ